MVLICFLALLPSLKLTPRSPEPTWLDRSLAGFTLSKSEETLVRDAKTGYYVLRTNDCDGALVTLELTRDRREIPADLLQSAKSDDGGKKPTRISQAIRRLSTGKGVRVDYTTSQVRRVLGKPTQVLPSGDRGQFTDFIYECNLKESGINGRVNYIETYTFKHGKLIQIIFFRDASKDGGGD